jgi:hypothetical protein
MRSIKLKKEPISENLKEKYKLGSLIKTSYSPNTNLKLNKIVVYQFSKELNDIEFKQLNDIVIDINLFGIIIGPLVRFDYSVNLIKNPGKFSGVFTQCLINNFNCFINIEKIKLF